MKKIISCLIAFSILILSLAGCGGGNGGNGGNGEKKSYVSGLDGAKLALANERLSGKLIDGSDSVFEGMSEGLRSMAAEGRAILANSGAHMTVPYEANVSYAPMAENTPVFLKSSISFSLTENSFIYSIILSSPPEIV